MAARYLENPALNLPQRGTVSVSHLLAISGMSMASRMKQKTAVYTQENEHLGRIVDSSPMHTGYNGSRSLLIPLSFYKQKLWSQVYTHSAGQ